MHGGCTKGCKVRVDDVPGSDCRLGCLHREWVESFRLARHDWEMQLESATKGAYGGDEEADFRRDFPPPTLAVWMKHRA